MTIAQKLTRWWNCQSNWGAFWWGIARDDIRDAEIRIFSTGASWPGVLGIYTPPIVRIPTSLEIAFCREVFQFDLARFWNDIRDGVLDENGYEYNEE